MRTFGAARLLFGAIAAVLMLLNCQGAMASGYDSFGSGGSVGGSTGSFGGCWGSRGGGFPTPVRDFFAYRQPVRSLLRNTGAVFSNWAGGSSGFASSGGFNNNVSFGSTGFQRSFASRGGSTGYSYYSSTGTVTGLQPGCGAIHPIASNCGGSCGGICAGCQTAPGAVVSGVPAVSNSDGSVIETDTSVVPSNQYYDSEPNSFPGGSSEGSGVRGTEIPPVPQPDTDETTATYRNSILSVSVPEAAKIYVNGRLTKTPGSLREYVSRDLETGKMHEFNLEAVWVRDGKEMSIKKSIALSGGQNGHIDFDFDQPLLTQLTLKVPENAKVTLSGNQTEAIGRVRDYKTEMKPGNVWEDYEISVSFDVDGETISKQRKISIAAGEKYVVDFTVDDQFYVSK